MVSDSSNSQLLNRATQGLYPPGSTFKIVTTLAYMRSKHNLDKFRYDCTGIFEIGNTTVHCYKDAVHGEEDFKYAFAHSCNTAFAQIGLDTGAKALGDTAEKLLIGKELPSDLYASKSRYSLTEQSGEAELVQTAFGQGKTLVTPYQMALIVAAIANDGVLMKPYLIDHAVTPTGKILNQTKPSKYTTLMTKSETQVLKQLMKAVVDDGSASALSGRSYEVAGKTGSAEFTKSDGTVGTHSWFVGYTGGDNPDLVISVLAENGGAGSSTAVPIAERILDSWYSEW
jgi:peptidoglycan glycosyltransferase